MKTTHFGLQFLWPELCALERVISIIFYGQNFVAQEKFRRNFGNSNGKSYEEASCPNQGQKKGDAET